MSGSSHCHVAVDLGGASGRVYAACLANGRVTMRSLHRFANRPLEADGTLRWNLARIEAEIRQGLAIAGIQAPDEVDLTLGIDTWALDYCRVDTGRGASPLPSPRHYRDPSIASGIELVHRRIPFDELYRETGIQFLPFNTIYQLATEQPLSPEAHEQIMLIPDALIYRLTGSTGAEITNASCTGLFDVRTRRWHDRVIDRVGINRSLLPEPVEPGTIVGPTLETFGGRQFTVVRVASHDTASAVVATPGEGEEWAFISSGTWSLVGVELHRAVITDDALAANLTNELGLDGTVRCLRNVAGMWLLQESMRMWRSCGRPWKLGGLLAAAARRSAGPTFDPDDPELLAPGDMPARIRARCGDLPDDVAVTRSILDSLAAKYASVLAQLESVTNRRIGTVHVVGGGARNSLLCQLTADVSGRQVVAGPAEATALGNALVQARAVGTTHGDLDDLRRIIRASTRLRTYLPRRDT